MMYSLYLFIFQKILHVQQTSGSEVIASGILKKSLEKAEKCRKWPFFDVFGNYLINGSNDFDEFFDMM